MVWIHQGNFEERRRHERIFLEGYLIESGRDENLMVQDQANRVDVE